MRGTDVHQEGLFSYLSPESRIPQRHPLRPVREMVDIALSELSGQFESMYSDTGRRSIPPEKLLRALLLQILYSIRSERMLCEQLDYNLLFRWFIGLSMDDPVWDHSTFSKNRDRLLESDIARGLFDAILAQAEARDLTSDEHFTVDGTLIEAWASLKSVRAKDGSDDPPEGGGRNPERDFHGQKRKNDTHESSTDPESRLYRKGRGKEARFYYMGHVLMENRHGLVVDGDLTEASGTAERDTAVDCWPNARAHSGLRSVATSFTTPKALLRNFANSGRPRMWHRMTPTDARPSMHALPDIAVMTSASGCASALKRYLAGARMSDRYEKPNFGARTELAFNCC